MTAARATLSPNDDNAWAEKTARYSRLARVSRIVAWRLADSSVPDTGGAPFLGRGSGVKRSQSRPNQLLRAKKGQMAANRDAVQRCTERTDDNRLTTRRATLPSGWIANGREIGQKQPFDTEPDGAQ